MLVAEIADLVPWWAPRFFRSMAAILRVEPGVRPRSPDGPRPAPLAHPGGRRWPPYRELSANLDASASRRRHDELRSGHRPQLHAVRQVSRPSGRSRRRALDRLPRRERRILRGGRRAGQARTAPFRRGHDGLSAGRGRQRSAGEAPLPGRGPDRARDRDRGPGQAASPDRGDRRQRPRRRDSPSRRWRSSTCRPRRSRGTEMAVLVRTSGDPSALAPAVRARIQALDPMLAVEDVEPLTGSSRGRSASAGSRCCFLGAFAGLALAAGGGRHLRRRRVPSRAARPRGRHPHGWARARRRARALSVGERPSREPASRPGSSGDRRRA